MQLQELYRDIGRIVQVEYNESSILPGLPEYNHRRVGYIKTVGFNSLTLAECNPKQESVKKIDQRQDYFSSLIRILEGHLPLQLPAIEAAGIKKIEEISPLEITAGNIDSLMIGRPIRFQYQGTTGVAYVREITPEKVVVDAFDPTMESQKKKWHNISYRASFPLMKLLLDARPLEVTTILMGEHKK